jgi:hypothetical protein
LRNPKIVEHCKYSGFKVSKCAVGADQKCKRKKTDFSKRKILKKLKKYLTNMSNYLCYLMPCRTCQQF